MRFARAVALARLVAILCCALGQSRLAALPFTPSANNPVRADGVTEQPFTIQAAANPGQAKQPARWNKRDVQLPPAATETLYTYNLAEFVLNPSDVEVRYEWHGPAWLKISASSGELYGLPDKAITSSQVGTVIVRSIIDGVAFEDRLEVEIPINTVNHPPQWTKNSLRLPDALAEAEYRQDLSRAAVDPDGDPLTYRIISPPTWLSIDPQTAILSGTPPDSESGDQTWNISATDPTGLSDTVIVQIKVVRPNRPPQWKEQSLVLSPAKQGTSYVVDLSPFVSDPDADPIEFAMVSGPEWVSVSPTGILSAMAGADVIAGHQAHVRASDNKSGSSTVKFMIFVEPVNKAPRFLLDPIYFSVKEEQATSFDLSPYASDDGPTEELVFGILEAPSWVKLSRHGLLELTAPHDRLGEVTIRVRIQDRGNLKADTSVIFDITPVNHPPRFKTDVIQLSAARVGEIYRASIANAAEDPDSADTLRFERADSASAWVTVEANGAISGTPPSDSIGLNRIGVRVIDRSHETAESEVHIVVIQQNRPPRWLQPSLELPTAVGDEDYTGDISLFATDDDGDRLVFEKLSGPEWLTVSDSGKLGGKPTLELLGEFIAGFSVRDHESSVTIQAKGQVIKQNRAPVIAEIPQLVVRMRNLLAIDLADPVYVFDPDEDRLLFQLNQTSDWIQLTEDGKLTIRPIRQSEGDTVIMFTVTDGTLSTDGKLSIKIVADPRPPIWLEDPIPAVARASEHFDFDLAPKALDLDNQPLRFKKSSGPDWLSVDERGKASGTTPEQVEVLQPFTVTVCNDTLCADANLHITIAQHIVTQTIALETSTPSAPVDLLWVIDNSPSNDATIRKLKHGIGQLFTALDKRSIDARSTILSSEFSTWTAEPVAEAGTPVSVSSTSEQRLVEFNLRTDLALSADQCSNCYSSPIYTLLEFLSSRRTSDQKLVSTEAPIDAVIVTSQRDHYPKFLNNDKHYSPKELSVRLAELARIQGTSLRLHTMTPRCPELIERSGDLSSVAPAETFQILTSMSYGQVLAPTCDFDMRRALEKLATSLSARGRTHAHRQIALTRSVKNQSDIIVQLDGRTLIGPELGKEHQWTFDNETNSLLMYWGKIDLGQMTGREILKIEYTTTDTK